LRVQSLTALVLAFSCILPAVPGIAQEVARDTAQATTQTTQQPPPLRPLELSEIADSAVGARSLLREASRSADTTDDLAEIANAFSGQTGHIDILEQETRRQMQMDGPGFALDQTEHAWQRVDERLAGWLRTLSSNATAVSSALDQIDAEQRLWEMTRDSTRADDVPAEVTREIRQTLAAIDSVQGVVRVARDTVLKLQAAVGEQKSRADQYLADERQEIGRRRGSLVSIDSPPVWKMFEQPDDQRSLSERAEATWQLNYQTLRWYVEQQESRLLWSLVLLLALIAALFSLRGAAGTQLQSDDSPRVAAGFLDRPVAAGFLIAALVGYMIQPNAPRAWNAVIGLVFLVAAVRLIPRILAELARSWGYVAAILFILQQAVKLATFGTPESRVILLLLSLTGLGATLWLAKSRALAESTISNRWHRAIGFGVRLSSIAFAVGVIANIVGGVGFAAVVTTGTVHLIFAAVGFWLAAAAVLGFVSLATSTERASRLGITPAIAETIDRVARRVVGVLAVVGWAGTALAGFGLLDPVTSALKDLLDAGISVGNFSLTVGDVLIFSFIVWLALKLSQLISFVLGTDILPHVDLPRGVPAVITKLIQYAVILVGILVAFSAVGFDVDRITILFGALGVGVGFGLQGVVNNFASGLVVLFGRAINFGDAVQFDDFEGVVEDIGLLQSTVRTYHGADVLVPNSTLISSTVVNWTRDDNDIRRIDVPVGVVYGTDPNSVIEVLEGAATKHPLVVQNPAPKALFLGFGDNSLKFQLNVWFTVDKWYNASSDLRIGVSDALNAAGIEIARPQRDLHLRSIDEGVSFDMKSQDENNG
jgi:small-conductance mechanosensitive channel